MIEPVTTSATADANTGDSGFSVRHDAARDLIRIDGFGFLSIEQFDALFDALQSLIDARRARNRPVRVLVDNRLIALHGADAAERVRHGALGTYRDGDRTAIVVDSALARLQLRRLLDPRTHRFFADEATAIAWLDGHG